MLPKIFLLGGSDGECQERGYGYVLFVHQSLFLVTVALVIVSLIQMLLVTNTTALQLH
jgi:hypothetical protein